MFKVYLKALRRLLGQRPYYRRLWGYFEPQGFMSFLLDGSAAIACRAKNAPASSLSGIQGCPANPENVGRGVSHESGLLQSCSKSDSNSRLERQTLNPKP